VQSVRVHGSVSGHDRCAGGALRRVVRGCERHATGMLECMLFCWVGRRLWCSPQGMVPWWQPRGRGQMDRGGMHRSGGARSGREGLIGWDIPTQTCALSSGKQPVRRLASGAGGQG